MTRPRVNVEGDTHPWNTWIFLKDTKVTNLIVWSKNLYKEKYTSLIAPKENILVLEKLETLMPSEITAI